MPGDSIAGAAAVPDPRLADLHMSTPQAFRVLVKGSTRLRPGVWGADRCWRPEAVHQRLHGPGPTEAGGAPVDPGRRLHGRLPHHLRRRQGARGLCQLCGVSLAAEKPGGMGLATRRAWSSSPWDLSSMSTIELLQSAWSLTCVGSVMEVIRAACRASGRGGGQQDTLSIPLCMRSTSCFGPVNVLKYDIRV